jgi:hypothetical protein
MQFEITEGKDGYRVEMTGQQLVEAQTTDRVIAINNESGDIHQINISKVNWYDEKTVSGHERGCYDSIQKVKFDADAHYAVFYFPHTRIPYMIAIKMPF